VPAATPNQTIGPYWHLLHDPEWSDLTRFGVKGEKIVLMGKVADGDGAPVSDAAVEIWQADPPAGETFQGFGRTATDSAGRFRFITVKPGPVRGRGNVPQAPHIAVTIMARGLLKGLVTRAYFAGEPLNDTDPLLCAIADPSRRATLIAQREPPEPAETAAHPEVWRLDILLQGGNETVFLDI
jgi:protocatechuate 3,4-dioxygenase, alpha subunit